MRDRDARIKEIVRIYRDAQNKIVKELTNVGVSPYKENEASKVSRRVRDLLLRLNVRTNAWADATISRIYADERKRLKVIFDVLGLESTQSETFVTSAMDNSYSKIVGDMAKAMRAIKRSSDLYLYLVRKSAKLPMKIQEFDEDDVSDLGGFFEELTDEALDGNWSRKRLSDLIENKLRSAIGTGNLIQINGRNYSIDSYAEMVARTRLAEAYTQATKSMCEEYNCDLVVWSSHANPCADCAQLEGQVFSISGSNPNYPELTGDVEPPLHPNCEHSISPTSERAIDINRAYREAYERSNP